MTPYYSDDYVTLYHGDCREITEWLAGDVMVTDPPYGIGWKQSAGTWRGCGVRKDGIANDEDTAARDEALQLWGQRPALVFGSFKAPPPIGWVELLVWHKADNAGVIGSARGWRRDVEPIYVLGDWPPRNACWSSVERSNESGMAPQKATGHSHAKPLDLMRSLIGKCPSGVIVDPFTGSGTTLRAAKDLGRKAIGVELDERYCEIAANRLGQEVLDFGGVR